VPLGLEIRQGSFQMTEFGFGLTFPGGQTVPPEPLLLVGTMCPGVNEMGRSRTSCGAGGLPESGSFEVGFIGQINRFCGQLCQGGGPVEVRERDFTLPRHLAGPDRPCLRSLDRIGQAGEPGSFLIPARNGDLEMLQGSRPVGGFGGHLAGDLNEAAGFGAVDLFGGVHRQDLFRRRGIASGQGQQGPGLDCLQGRPPGSGNPGQGRRGVVTPAGFFFGQGQKAGGHEFLFPPIGRLPGGELPPGGFGIQAGLRCSQGIQIVMNEFEFLHGVVVVQQVGRRPGPAGFQQVGGSQDRGAGQIPEILGCGTGALGRSTGDQ